MFVSNMSSARWVLTGCCAMICSWSSLGWGACSGWQSSGPAAAPSRWKSELEHLKAEFASSHDWQKFLGAVESNSATWGEDPHSRLQTLEALADSTASVALSGPGESVSAMNDTVQSLLVKLRRDSQTNGQGSVEFGCRAASALDYWGRNLAKSQPQLAAELWLEVGSVARRLHQNPQYPGPAKGGLSVYLVSEARGHALRGADDAALAAVQESLAWGLVEFSQVLRDPHLVGSLKFPEIEKLVMARAQQYRQQITPGIQQAMASFQTFAFDFQLPDVAGNLHAKRQLLGRVTVVDLWGTWCAPCRAEIPHLNQLAEQFAERDVKIVGIAMEQAETLAEQQAAVRHFCETTPLNYPCLLGNEQVTRQLPNFRSYPTLVFLDSRGQVRFSTSGYLDETQLEVIVEQMLRREAQVGVPSHQAQ